MTDYRDGVRALIDPEQTWRLPDGRRVQEISVIMIDDPDHDASRGRGWLPPAAVTLTPDEAREFAFELLQFAEQAERVGGRP
jgi:hypothetical protein